MSKPRWRVGRKLGRTLYLDEQLVGMVDTPELASEIAAAMNGDLSERLVDCVRQLVHEKYVSGEVLEFAREALSRMRHIQVGAVRDE